MAFRFGAASLVMLTLLMFGMAAPVSAYPDYSYNYSIWAEPEPAPYAYEPVKSIYGADLGIGDFNNPQDVFVSEDRQIFVADTGNNRIVWLKEDGRLERIIDSFEHDGAKETFNQPSGIFVSQKNGIMIADTLNRRIVALNRDGKLIKIYGTPTSGILPADFIFKPLKVSVDRADRIYVIAQDVFEGIMELDTTGALRGYVGTNKVRFKPADLLWKRISTQRQSSQMKLFLPIEFNNMDVDDRGFIFATTPSIRTSAPIKRLNPGGEDIMRRKGVDITGDLSVFGIANDYTGGELPAFLQRQGNSKFVDVVADADGLFSALDATRNRVFTYDQDGNLLYQFGGLGTKESNFRATTALDMLGDNALVLDPVTNRLAVFAPTRYGALIRKANHIHYTGNPDEAAVAWHDVLKLNANYDIAYSGMGKAMSKKGEYKLAMEYFKNGNNQKYYSEAFKQYRKQYLYDNFGPILLSCLAVGVVMIAVRVVWVKRRPQLHFIETGIYKFPFYTIMRPFKGFWELKYERKGRLWIAIAILAALVATMVLKRQYDGFLINLYKPNTFNGVEQLFYIVAPLLLFCIANWSLTTLMDGEGKFRDIFLATCYALLPLVLIFLPLIVVSNFITYEEYSLVAALFSIAYLWFGWLLFVGMMTVHQYSIVKTVVTFFLTLLVMAFIVFLLMLILSLIQQVTSFGYSFFREISIRM